MPRKARLCVPGVLHHVTANVIRNQKFFRDNQDKEKFLNYLRFFLGKTGFVLYSLNLYDSHYHMIIRINHLPLQALYRGLHSAYARYYNKRYGLSGYFFQGRPKTVVVEDGKDSQELMRYINTGPIRAGLCKTLEDLDIFPWGTHSAIMGFQKFPFLKTENVLDIFKNNTDSDPKALYCEFLRMGIENSQGDQKFIALLKGANKEKEDMHEPGYWVIGSRKFVKETIEQDQLKRIRIAQHRVDGWDYDNLAEFVTSAMMISLADLKKRSRSDPVSDARKLYCYFAISVLDMSYTRAAYKLNVSRSAVARMAKLGKAIAERMDLQLPKIPIFKNCKHLFY